MTYFTNEFTVSATGAYYIVREVRETRDLSLATWGGVEPDKISLD